MDSTQKEGSKNKTFVGGAIILGVAGLLVKILGASFRIPLGNIIGDEGMGYYQTAYPIYNLFLTLAIAGIPTSIARMTSERYAKGRPYEAYRVFRLTTVLLFLTGVAFSLILYFGSGPISNWIHEPDAVYSLRATAIALLFVPLMGSFRGFFQGRQNMKPTAISQVVEQLFRVAVGLWLAVALLPKGLPYAAAGASFGAAAGGIAGFLTILGIYLASRPKIKCELDATDRTPLESNRSILWSILTIAVPITLGASVMPIINALDTAIVKARLISTGYASDVARGLYGQLTGMAAPIINVPQVFTQAVSMSLVPVVASAFQRGDTEFMKKNITLGLRYAMIISAPCAVGMIVLAKPIMLMFYPLQQESAVNAASCLAVLAVGTIFLALVHASTGTLQGIGRQTVPVRNLCFGALAKVVVTYTLTAIPALNLRGAACGTVAAYFTAAALNILCVARYTGTKPEPVLTFVKPLFSACVMGGGVALCYWALSHVFGNVISCLLSIVAGVVIYVLMVLVTRTLTSEELSSMPGARKIAPLLRKLHLLR